MPVTVVVGMQEDEPMGTAGPLGLARELLDDGSGEPFFVLNRCWSACQCMGCTQPLQALHLDSIHCLQTSLQ